MGVKSLLEIEKDDNLLFLCRVDVIVYFEENQVHIYKQVTGFDKVVNYIYHLIFVIIVC